MCVSIYPRLDDKNDGFITTRGRIVVFGQQADKSGEPVH